ncbi:MAG: DUF3263 domain-containing protein [Mycobacterium sp.]
MDTLTDTDRAILDLERQFWHTAGGKEDAIRALGMTPVRYYQRVNRLLGERAAVEYAALTVHRLRRISEPRQRDRLRSGI